MPTSRIRAERATIRVFDLAGSQVRRLEKNGPENYFRWNLRTDEDLPIASGVYFMRAKNEGETSVRKMTLLK